MLSQDKLNTDTGKLHIFIQRASRDTKKLQVIVQRASGVSKALWPANMRRSVVLGQPQRRRSRIARRKWQVKLEAIFRMRYPSAFVAISMFISAAIAVLLELRLWYLLLIPVLMLAIVRAIVLKIAVRALPTSLQRSPETPLPAGPPLVRVLETFDLSHSNVEHFIDAPPAGDTSPLAIDWPEKQNVGA